MRKYLLISILLMTMVSSYAQTKSKQKKQEKPPTQSEMDKIMNEAQMEMDNMDPETLRMIDSMGITRPSFKNVPKVSDKQLADAWEDENRIVPKRDAVRIAAIPKNVTDARLSAYISIIQSEATTLLKPEVKNMSNKIYAYIKSNSKNSSEAGNMASGFWIAGKPELAFYTLGKICADDPKNTDNLSNYASMLSMEGGQHLAIPILVNLNAKFPKNSTLLNNLGQAWFGLGDIAKAEKYLDSAIAIYAYHPQANMTKAAIEESRGNTEKAKENIKKSSKHAYTKEKEEKLSKLGEKINHKDFRMPRRSKADPMNLGSFSTPDFPLSVEACVQAEKQWNEIFAQVDEEISQLKNQWERANETAMKGYQQRMNADEALVKAALANPGVQGQFVSVPLYAERAGRKYTAYMEMYGQKLEVFSKKFFAFTTGEELSLKKDYDKKMEDLHKKDAEQTGEGLPNKDFCPQYKEASDKYLKDINAKLQQFYNEALGLQKEFINESAYWNMFIVWPDMFEAMKLDYKIQWLSTHKQILGKQGGSGYPFISITEYICATDEKGPQKTKLQKFDDVACQYNDTLDLVAIQFYNNCSQMTSKLNVKFIEYTRYDDFERAEGDTYTSSTIKISGEKGFDNLKAAKGPLKIEVKAGAGIEFEFDRDGVKDVTLIAEVKIGIGHNTYDEGLEESGSIGGKDVVDTTIEVGVEGRISIISGKGSVGGTGKLSGVKIADW